MLKKGHELLGGRLSSPSWIPSYAPVHYYFSTHAPRSAYLERIRAPHRPLVARPSATVSSLCRYPCRCHCCHAVVEHHCSTHSARCWTRLAAHCCRGRTQGPARTSLRRSIACRAQTLAASPSGSHTNSFT